MKTFLRIGALTLTLALSTPTPAAGTDMQLGVYVASGDIDRSTKFYAALFQVEPYLQTRTFVSFAINGGRFGIMPTAAYAYPMTRGNSAIPNILVVDIDAAYARIKALKPTMIQAKIATVGRMRLFDFTDPDGNVIEVFSLLP